MLAVGLGLIAAVAAVFVSLGLSDSPSVDPIAEAATASANAPGFKMKLGFVITSPQLGAPISVLGSAVVDPPDHAASMSLTIDSSQLDQSDQTDSAPTHPGSGKFQLGMVLVGQEMYMRFPQSLVNAVPSLNGKPWVEVNVAKAAGLPGLSSLGDNPDASDPQAVLQELQSVSDGVIDEGRQQVDGVLTTHYVATVSLDRLYGNLSSLDRAVLQQIDPSQDVPIEVWIDAHHLVRRIVMTLTLGAANGPSIQETATTDLSDYGRQPRPTLPPADQVMSGNGIAGLSG